MQRVSVNKFISWIRKIWWDVFLRNQSVDLHRLDILILILLYNRWFLSSGQIFWDSFRESSPQRLKFRFNCCNCDINLLKRLIFLPLEICQIQHPRNSKCLLKDACTEVTGPVSIPVVVTNQLPATCSSTLDHSFPNSNTAWLIKIKCCFSTFKPETINISFFDLYDK